MWKRDGIVLILSATSIFATALSPILSADIPLLAAYLNVDYTDIALLTGYCLFGTGIGGVLAVPSARIWGKRHLFLLGTLLLIVSSAWAGATQSYSSLLWARIFQGIGIAPFEALINVSVGDLYFIHVWLDVFWSYKAHILTEEQERGKRMALTNLAVFGGAFFSPILVGKIVSSLGWRWTFHFVTIFTSICFPLVFFLVPETAFRRSAYLNIDMASTDSVQIPPKSEETSHGIHAFNGKEEPVTLPVRPLDATDESSDPDPESHIAVQDFSAASIPEKSFLAMLAPFNGRMTGDNYFKLFLRPFPLFTHPGIVWACLIQGSTIGWSVIIGVIIAVVFIEPPLHWGAVTTGYAYAGAFIGALAGFVIAGIVADWSTKYMTRKNNGIFEPEFRIVLVIPQLVFGCTGLYLFGITAGSLTRYSWAPPVVAFGFEVCAMVIGAVASSLYIVDAHRGLHYTRGILIILTRL